MATLEDIKVLLEEANGGNTDFAEQQQDFHLQQLDLLDGILSSLEGMSSALSTLSIDGNLNVEIEPSLEPTPHESSVQLSNDHTVEILESIDKNIANNHVDIIDALWRIIDQDKIVIQQQAAKDRKESRTGSVLSNLNPKNMVKGLKNMMPSMPKMPKFGGLLKGISGIGLAGGAVMGGAGLLAMGGSELIKTIQDMDASKITKNIRELLTIGDMFEDGNWEFMKEGGAFFLAMTGIGLGLAAFALGSGVSASVEFFTKEGNWAQGVVDSVSTLLTLSSEAKAVNLLGSGFALGAALTSIGIGIAAFSTGKGVAAAIDQFDGGDWAQGIVDNVKTLLTLGDDKLFGMVSVLSGSVTLGTALAAIGVGIAAFSAGEGVAAAIKQFDGGNWAQGIVDNVNTLLTLGSDVVFGKLGVLAQGAALAVGLGFIGSGIAAFSAGEGVASAIDMFDGGDWAQSIVDNVNTLLSLGDARMFGMASVLAEGAVFATAMGAISAGLLAFSAGEAATAVSQFMSNDAWAQTIVDNVETLLSIADLENMSVANVAVVGATLSALGVGLASFGIGQNLVGLAQMIDNDGDWVGTLKKNVQDLLSIPDDLPEDAAVKTLTMTGVLAELGIGLAAFGAGSWIGTLAGAGEAILGFFGVKSPFEKVMEIAESRQDILHGSIALDRLSASLERFSALDISAPEIDFKGFAASIAEAIPLLRAASEGGTIKVGGFLGVGADTYDFGPKKTPGTGGILDPDLNIDQVIERVQTYLNAGGPTGSIAGLQQESVVNSSSMQLAQQSLNETKTTNYVTQSAGNNTSVASVDNSSSVINSYYQSGMASPIDASDKASQPLIRR